jgi:hypothetical protein
MGARSRRTITNASVGDINHEAAARDAAREQLLETIAQTRQCPKCGAKDYDEVPA